MNYQNRISIISSTQGKFSLILDQMLEALNNKVQAQTIVSDSIIFSESSKKFVKINSGSNKIIKEWEIYNKDISKEIIEKVIKFEKEILKESLYKAIVVDRRYLFGKHCKSKQDYSQRFSVEELERRLYLMASEIIDIFDQKKVDVALSFGISNIQDYLIYKISKSKGIPFFQIRSTKIENYVTAFDNIEGAPTFNDSHINPEIIASTKKFIERIHMVGNKYEGSIKTSRVELVNSLRNIIAGIKNDFLKFSNKIYRNDNQVEWLFLHNFRLEFLNKIKWFVQSKLYFNNNFDNSKQNFFYPMHFEPEIAIQFFGPSFLNQIELIRTISQSLPINGRLIIREHPRSFGFRSNSYYRKLKAIPKVILLSPKFSMNEAVDKSHGVFTISGSTGLEAIIKNKPAWVFGKPYFVDIGKKMVCHITSLNDLDKVIFSHLNEYEYDIKKIENFIANLLNISVRFNLYTESLEKKGRNKVGGEALSIHDFSEYVYKSMIARL